MATSPYMPFYIADYLADAAHLTLEEHGAYLLLVMTYWQRGEALPDNDRQLARICHCSYKQWLFLKPTISEFFIIDADKWVNPMVEEVLHDKKYRVDIRRLSGVEWEEIRQYIFERDNYTCTYCGDTSAKLECDHIHPVVKGGTNETENLTTACMRCNRSKRDKTVEEWL